MAIDPMTALSIGQSVMGFFDAQEKAKQQEIAYQQNRLASATARDMKIQALNARAIQESERVAGAKLENAIKALEVRESKIVAAGEAGVEGQGIQAQLDMTEARRLRGDTIYNQQLEGIFQQMDYEKQGINAEALNRINSMSRGQPPSFLRAAVGAAASAYATELSYGGNQKGSFLSNIGLGGTTSPYQSQPLPPVINITS
jgi:hypothetical protein